MERSEVRELRLMRLPRWRVAVLLMITVLVVATLNNRGPLHTAACSFTGREGWTIELPTSRVPLSDFRSHISGQTRNCVRVIAPSDAEGADHVVSPIGTRTWVGSSREIQVRIVPEDGTR